MQYADKTLTCRDCGNPFTFTSGEQSFYASRGFENPPGRCPSCRAARKQERGGGSPSSYASYGADGYGASPGGRGSFATGGGVGGGAGRQMFSTVCASCGNEARVPFQPRGDRPVYCSNCFETQRGQTSHSTFS